MALVELDRGVLLVKRAVAAQDLLPGARRDDVKRDPRLVDGQLDHAAELADREGSRLFLRLPIAITFDRNLVETVLSNGPADPGVEHLQPLRFAQIGAAHNAMPDH